eukprot:TRINITY_DN108901_c0_g1_i1.p1 TRINITY_DN108901_c0_g1~~TRINITY_DN108901_c0_g1_i1.p1  ORF type:complete len:526 (+),score=69.78 TRINITY_DN108901_c0_g1_i1:34-1578(+)
MSGLQDALSAAEEGDSQKELAETRKLVELAAQRCTELRRAVERAKAGNHFGPPPSAGPPSWDQRPCVPTAVETSEGKVWISQPTQQRAVGCLAPQPVNSTAGPFQVGSLAGPSCSPMRRTSAASPIVSTSHAAQTTAAARNPAAPAWPYVVRAVSANPMAYQRSGSPPPQVLTMSSGQAGSQALRPAIATSPAPVYRRVNAPPVSRKISYDAPRSLSPSRPVVVTSQNSTWKGPCSTAIPSAPSTSTLPLPDARDTHDQAQGYADATSSSTRCADSADEVKAEANGHDGSHSRSMMGWNSQIRSPLELLQSGNLCARSRAYLYQAPFSPSMRYIDGEEFFVVPEGWGVLRTKCGLLLWLELMDDERLATIVADMEASSTDASAKGGTRPEGATPPAGGKALTKERDARRSKSATPPPPAPRRLQTALVLRLPATDGSLRSELTARSRGCCNTNTLLRLPCEDVLVLHPTGGKGTGIRAALTVASDGSKSGADVTAKNGVDIPLKAWLSAWETQI